MKNLLTYLIIGTLGLTIVSLPSTHKIAKAQEIENLQRLSLLRDYIEEYKRINSLYDSLIKTGIGTNDVENITCLQLKNLSKNNPVAHSYFIENVQELRQQVLGCRVRGVNF